MIPLIAHANEKLSGDIKVPGDKSISHRALMIGALAVGQTRIEGLLEGEDVLATAAALKALGVDIETDSGDGTWRVSGRGVSGLCEPGPVLDMGNSGTAARLLMGVLAGHPFSATISGDESLNSRPMARITEPLGKMGAVFRCRTGHRLPIGMDGLAQPLPIDYELRGPLNLPGTLVIQPAKVEEPQPVPEAEAT